MKTSKRSLSTAPNRNDKSKQTGNKSAQIKEETLLMDYEQRNFDVYREQLTKWLRTKEGRKPRQGPYD